MMLPRRSLLLKTLLFVFMAAVCIFLFSWRTSFPPPESRNNSPAPQAIAPESEGKQGPAAVPTHPAADLSKFRFATQWGLESNPALAAFSQWAERFTHAPATLRGEMLAEGVLLARERRTAFKSLIQRQPKAALAQAVPALVRSELPPEILALLEERVTGKGDLLALGRTAPRGVDAAARRVVIEDRRYEAFVYGARASQRSKSNISIHGVAIDGQLALSDSPLRVFEEGEIVPADKPLAADSCVISRQPTAPTSNGPRAGAVAAESGDKVYWMCHGGHVTAAADQVSALEEQFTFQAYAASGTRNALVMVVDFSDLTGPASPPETVEATLHSVSQFLEKNSYNDLHLSSHTVTPLLRMPRTAQYYGTASGGDETLLNDARVAARAAGFRSEDYDFDLVSFSDVDFPWIGQGYIGRKGAWIQGNFTSDPVAHELGHNLGVWHANSWNATESPISLRGEHEEYGNPFDDMGHPGGFPDSHYNANFKSLYGWLPEPNIAVINTSGSFRLYAHDQASRVPDRHYALKIPVAIFAGNEVEDYWVEFRQLQATRFPATADGAILQWGNDAGSPSANRLLDMNFLTSTKSDAPLALNQTFSDPERGLTITPIAKSGEGAEAFLDINVTIITPPTVPLAEALDNDAFTWTTSTPPWTGQTAISHDGVDAAASATTRENSETYLETTVEGPGALFFWWKVSSEESFDFLRFTVDNRELASISGEVNWHRRGCELSPGPHTIRWSYKKDGGTIAGSDRAWVDEVTLITGEYPPFINSQSLTVLAPVGGAAQMNINAIGSAPLTYEWRKLDDGGDEVPIPGQNDSTLFIPAVQLSDGGIYNCRIANSAGSIVSTNIILTVIHDVTIADALDTGDTIDWETFGATPWRGSQEATHDGIDAAQTGTILNGKDTSLSATLRGPGQLTFWWKSSTEADYDRLSLYLDGDLIDQISGETEWTQKLVVIPNGNHILRWTYAKDGNLSEGQDAAWVDQVQFTPSLGLAPEVVTPPNAQFVSLGGSAQFTVRFIATEPATLVWRKDGVPLVAKPSLSGVNSPTLTITNVQNFDIGDYSLKIENAMGEAISLSAALNIVPVSIADALDQPQRVWLASGAAPWLPQTVTTHDAIDAAQTGAIADGGSTGIQTEITGPANVSFWWKVSSEEDYDLFTLELDTLTVRTISGRQDWRQETLVLSPGKHTLRWKYQKDANTPGGDDAGWLDQIDIVQLEPPPQPQITDLITDDEGLSAQVIALPVTGNLVLECSADLKKWTPISTNEITAPTMKIRRPIAAAEEFLRVRVE